MVMCNCVKCGGTDEHMVCENQLIMMRSGIYRQERLNVTLLVVSLLLCVIGLTGAFF